MKRKDNMKAVDFVFELGSLKLVKRSGWWMAGIKDPESVAEHSFRAAAIAYLLAKEEGEDAEKICTAALFHDALETRLGDRHKVSQKYLETPKEVEEQIRHDQGIALPELDEKEEVIARDADLLEVAFQAKEYYEDGHKACWNWVERAGKAIKTRTARKWFQLMLETGSHDWWKGLKK